MTQPDPANVEVDVEHVLASLTAQIAQQARSIAFLEARLAANGTPTNDAG